MTLNTRSIKIFAKWVSYSGLAILIFLFGVGVGNGHIVFGAISSGAGSAGAPQQLDYSSVDGVYNLIRKDFDGQLDSQKLLDGLKSGLAQATGDPYTQYFSPSQAKEFDQELSGSFSGIGAELGQDSSGNLVVISAIADTPAAKAGLRNQDHILMVDNQDTSGWTIDQAVSKIRGPKGSQVALKLLRDKTQQLTLSITRDDIKVPSVKWSISDNLGYMQITQFNDDTSTLAMQAAEDFQKNQVKGVILDLRDDPGGRLDAAIEVSSLWLPKGQKILEERRGNVVTKTHLANGNNILKNMPTVVLINGGSASASEITAAALRDNNAATLVGEKSYGKGSVQELNPLPDHSEIKITIAHWYRPNGQNIDKKGIDPDKNVQMSDEDYKQGHDPQKDTAVNFLQNH